MKDADAMIATIAEKNNFSKLNLCAIWQVALL